MSQCARLLTHLKTSPITQADASNRLGIGRLASRILNLKERGVPIATEMVTVKNRFGEVCRVAQYRLEGEK